MRSKKAAMELSISTIVVIVLAMSMLIFGLILIKNIFAAGQNAIKMTDDQLSNELSKMYGAELKLGVYPNSKQIEVVLGKQGAFGVGIKNLRSGSTANTKFSYEVEVSDSRVEEKCGSGYSAEYMMALISVGESETDISIATGETYVTRVMFEPPTGGPLCTVRFRVTAKVNNEVYGSPQNMDVTFRSS